jgi:hypothetical protein
MAWECQCGMKSEPNPKELINFVLLDSCFQCRDFKISPHILYKKAKGNKEIYKNSLLAHKYLMPKKEKL